jgi:hypothetical protein
MWKMKHADEQKQSGKNIWYLLAISSLRLRAQSVQTY